MRIAWLAVALVTLGTSLSRGEDDFHLEEGFTLLFNGKDLTGWVYRGSKEDLTGKTATADGRIVVENGMIVMREKDNRGKGGIKGLYTRRTFPKAFHLKLEFRAGPRADSGVYVRGPQLQVRDFLRRNEHKHLSQSFRTDDWNTLDIVVRNDILTTTVNGKLLGPADTLALSMHDGQVVARLNGKEIVARHVQIRRGPVAECRCNGELFEVMTNLPTTGDLGLQAESGTFAFRRIRIKELE